jgi:hypothetical protein
LFDAEQAMDYRKRVAGHAQFCRKGRHLVEWFGSVVEREPPKGSRKIQHRLGVGLARPERAQLQPAKSPGCEGSRGLA